MNTGYRRQQYQQAQSQGSVPAWVLMGLALVAALAGLPWILLGFLTERLLQRWLHWRVSFLLWFLLLFIAAFALSRRPELFPMIQQVLLDSIIVLRQFNHHELTHLWAEVWPIWLRTWPGIGIAGFVAELSYGSRSTDTVQTLRQVERSRQRRAQRLQNRARRRTSRPTPILDEIGGIMVIGVPIDDDNEET